LADAWKVIRSDSDDKRSFHVISIIRSVVLDLVVPVAAEMIETEAVGFRIDDVQEAGFKADKLRGIYLALEDGILHSLPEVETSLGGPAQAGFSGGRGGGDVVGDEDVHEFEI
jgi:hypothetical protein